MARISVGGGVSDARAVPGQPGYVEPAPEQLPEETEAEFDAAWAEGEPVDVVVPADTTAPATAAVTEPEPVSLPGPDLAALPDDSKGGAK